MKLTTRERKEKVKEHLEEHAHSPSFHFYSPSFPGMWQQVPGSEGREPRYVGDFGKRDGGREEKQSECEDHLRRER